IPFLRVQNLSYTGFLKLDNCKYINKETHNNYLKRSQVLGGDLLVKITGVGRMAIASVAPEGFVGNTNQHMVVIKTKDRQTSEILAAYLNTDIGEMLATRRATGGTRPALDYPALLSIPIIFDTKILEIYKKAIESKKLKEKQAKELLEGIDPYLLNQLGITLPQIDNSLEKRIFEVKISSLSSKRTDAEAYLPYYDEVHKAINCTKYHQEYLNKVVFKVNRRFRAKRGVEYKYIQLGSIGIDSSEVVKPLNIKLPEIPSRAQQIVKTGEILFAIANPQWGTHVLVKKENNNFIASSGFIILDSDENNNYITEILRSNIYKKLYEKYLTGSGLFLNISTKDLLSLTIPLPPIEKQNEIAEYIQDTRDKAKQLKFEAVQGLENVKIEVEKMIMGS
ncbi:MAG TPA: restriction endonuclease subunit S, partial [Lutibacter sp.]|nr:restriction endonuclease subunit S [Lutibacter sp.]